MDTHSKIGIVVAMPEEMVYVKDLFLDLELVSSVPFEIFRALDRGREIFFITSGIGKVNAAIATTLLLDNYHVDLIINAGIAGGDGHNLKIGDLFIADRCVYYDADATVFGYQHGQIPRMPSFYQSTLQKLKLFTSIYPVPAHFGVVCTGDSFLTSKEKLKEIKAIFPEVLAIDMEAAAVGQACYHYEVPFLMIKGISDLIDEDSIEDSVAHVELATKNVVCFLRGFLGAL